MRQAVFALGRATERRAAAGDGVAFFALDVGAAGRAVSRCGDRLATLGGGRGNDRHYLWNHVSGTAQYHVVTWSSIEARDFIHIVQCSITHGDPTDEHRVQPRHGRDRTSSTDLKVDTLQSGLHLFCRKLAGNRPARRTRYE